MRQTRQRDAVLRAIRSRTDHPTADRLFGEVRHEVPHVSLGTVYRLLNHLAEEGLVRILPQPEGPARFDGDPGPHHHVACTRCGRVSDVPELLAPGARTEVERWTGFAVTGARLDWYGLCPACRSAPASDDDGTGP